MEKKKTQIKPLTHTWFLFFYQLTLQILEEAGVEGNRSINEAEFQLVVKKLPDFATSFKLIM